MHTPDAAGMGQSGNGHSSGKDMRRLLDSPAKNLRAGIFNFASGTLPAAPTYRTSALAVVRMIVAKDIVQRAQCRLNNLRKFQFQRAGHHMSSPTSAGLASSLPGCNVRALSTSLRVFRHYFTSAQKDFTNYLPCLPFGCESARLYR